MQWEGAPEREGSGPHKDLSASHRDSAVGQPLELSYLKPGDWALGSHGVRRFPGRRRDRGALVWPSIKGHSQSGDQAGLSAANLLKP